MGLRFLIVDSFVINFILMKKYFVLYIVVCACFVKTSVAQIKINEPLVQKSPLLQIPMVHITPVSSRFVPVHIDSVKPFVVSLNPIVFGDHENAACAHFKNFKATLELNADRANDVTANLQWHTKYAFYATGFNIERSLGDSLHFSTINFAAASEGGSFKKNYHLPDHNNYNGVSYYRIKQLNRDSEFAYSNVVAIKGHDAILLSLYPVPASDRIWIDVAPKQSGNLSVIVYDPAGRMVQQQSVSCTENRHAIQSLDISKLAAGVYQLKILMPDKSFLNGKFIKQ
jgi:hypothetical protein